MRLDIPSKVVYGCMVGRFIQKVFTLLSSKRGSVLGNGKVVGVFLVFADNDGDEKFFLLGTAELANLNFCATSLFDILREAHIHSIFYKFNRIEVRQMNQYPDSYGFITSTGTPCRFIDQSTQYAVIRAFKEFAA